MNMEPQITNKLTRESGLAACATKLCRWRPVLGALAIGLVVTSLAQTNTTNSVASQNQWPTFESFNAIQRNNIFDPNRRRWVPPSTNHTPRMEGFALKGTMSYSKGKFAFFDGTSSEYNKVLGVGGNIAGYTVKDITQTNVTLAANGKDFSMPVGRQVRKQQGGSWQMGHPIEAPSDETNGDETQASGDSSAPPPAANAQMSDILKRLMQAKEQESK